ncbi:MAG: hypothetical protein K2F77_00570 [Muribaculaceae bacterium]|nr:hypothetical protein [Muribaculaceae bacterium]
MRFCAVGLPLTPGGEGEGAVGPGQAGEYGEGMQLHINGEKVSESALEGLSNDKIASVSVDSQNNIISITLK